MHNTASRPNPSRRRRVLSLEEGCRPPIYVPLGGRVPLYTNLSNSSTLSGAHFYRGEVVHIQSVLLLDRQTQRDVSRHQLGQKLQCNTLSQMTFRRENREKLIAYPRRTWVCYEEEIGLAGPNAWPSRSPDPKSVTFSYGVILNYSFMRRLWTYRRIS
ncbi:hypothetical protein AVEN_88360-1 [Araneus ventricosus]|uniref:Uncharacterized protein n=1 Tax=Araneus ventricosus TaxID=182803 RepID=A0A4Y2UBM6_ARAVE|nr:hypothetical protein AVEN_88360-1 [Araneus ventricosus]